MFTLYVGGDISDDGYYQGVPPERTLYLSSLQDTLYIYVESADTRYL